MKKIQELNNSKMPIIAIDSSLNKYRDQTLFPKKLALANQQLKGVKLPSNKSNGANSSKFGTDTMKHHRI